MTRKAFKYLTNIGVILLLITTALPGTPVEAGVGQVTRTSGSDRYATAAQVAVSNWTTSGNVILVSGEGYADAVSASTLAKKLNAPILLTTAEELNPNTLAALTSLEAKNVYVVGGTASISQNVRNKLKSKYTLTELGGKNRYETNIAVAKELANLGVDLSNIIMVGGEGFSDALSVAPVASAKEQIILLACNDVNCMKSAIDFTKAAGSDITVVGTTSVISDKIRGVFKGKSDIDGGYDRFDTNLKVLSAFSSSLNFNKVYIANASDDQYADALVASAVAGKTGAALVLLDSEKSQATANAIDYLKANISKTSELNVIGGTGVVANDTINTINTVLSRISHDIVVTFKDKNLEKAIRDCNKPTGIIYKSDINKISELKASGRRIEDISGIESLTSLQKLDLSCNGGINDISELSNLTNLKELNLSNTSIHDIRVLKDLVFLEKLDLSYNYEITDLSALSNLTNLQELNLNNAEINDINALKNLTNLQSLSLTDNNIKDINGLKNLTHLQKLDLKNSRPYDDPFGNKISDISGLKDLINLQYLNLNGTGINNIDALKNLTSLQELNLNNDEIKDISSLINLTNLQKLDLSCNGEINDISALKNLTNLKELDLSNTKISDTDKDFLKNSLTKCNIIY